MNATPMFVGVPNFLYCCIFFYLLAMHACTVTQQGSPEDALTARTTINEGRAFLAMIETEMDAILTKLTPVEITHRLILGDAPVLETDLASAFGSYLEQPSGSFQFTASGTAIRVAFQNGLDMHIHSFQFSGNPSKVTRFYGEVSPHNRSIVTPDIDNIEIHANGIRPDIADNLIIFSSPRVILQGTIAYFRDANRVLYEVTRSRGELNASFVGNTLAEVTRVSDIRIKDLSNGPDNAPFWYETESLLFRPIQNHSNWSAVSLAISYNDYRLANGSIGAQLDFQQTNSNQIAYTGAGTVSYQKRKVASVVGGPYYCDANTPSAQGSGAPVYVQWRDDINQQVIPSSDFSCAKLIVVQPSL